MTPAIVWLPCSVSQQFLWVFNTKYHWHLALLFYSMLSRCLIYVLKVLITSYQSSVLLKKKARKKLLTLASEKQPEHNPHYPPLTTTGTSCSCQMHCVIIPQVYLHFFPLLLVPEASDLGLSKISPPFTFGSNYLWWLFYCLAWELSTQALESSFLPVPRLWRELLQPVLGINLFVEGRGEMLCKGESWTATPLPQNLQSTLSAQELGWSSQILPAKTSSYPTPTPAGGRLGWGSFLQGRTLPRGTRSHASSTLLPCSWGNGAFLGPQRSSGQHTTASTTDLVSTQLAVGLQIGFLTFLHPYSLIQKIGGSSTFFSCLRIIWANPCNMQDSKKELKNAILTFVITTPRHVHMLLLYYHLKPFIVAHLTIVHNT